MGSPHFTDGAAPRALNFDGALAKKRPLSAFAILQGGDVFESIGGKGPKEGPPRAKAYTGTKLVFHAHGSKDELAERVRRDVVKLVEANLELLSRLEVARPIEIELVPAGHPLSRYGFPKSTHPSAVGLFWDDPSWASARMALRQEKLAEVPQLAVHEMAHAIHFLAFTKEERDLIYRVMLPTYGDRASVDEVFAIYTEREFLGRWTEHDKQQPGVYGMARQRWNENHVFTRFVRHLYYPDKPLAGR
jgi:hypothetical protein